MSGVKRNNDGKRKHIALKIPEKVELLKKLDSGTTVNLVAREYGISERTVYDIRKNRNKILSYYASSDSDLEIAKRKTIRAARSENLDKILFEWFKQRRNEGVPISGPILREKAKEIHNELNIIEPCNFTSGWLTSFKHRHGIRYLKTCGEKLSADKTAAEDFIDEFADLVRHENLSPEQIYNADEFGLFWRCLPRETFVCNDEKNPSGFKQAKERVTVLVCSNAAGTHKLKLLLIAKSANPRALKGVKSLPLIYKSNKRAWITAAMMTDWFETKFSKEARDHCLKIGLPSDCKILLLVDNCAAHPTNLTKDNVTAMFLPPNTTSLIQPMDQGVIHSVKATYRTEFLRRLIASNSTDNLIEYKKFFSIKDCIFLLAEVWSNLPQDTLVNSWHNIWPSSLFVDTETSTVCDFSGFRITHAKDKATELLNYAKNVLKDVPSFLEEECLVNFLECQDEPPVTQSMTDSEIIDSVLHSATVDSDTESDNEGDKITHADGLAFGYKYIDFVEKQHFISEQDIMTLHRIQKQIIDNKPKFKQANIVSMLNNLNSSNK